MNANASFRPHLHRGASRLGFPKSKPGGYIHKAGSDALDSLDPARIERMCKGNGTTVAPWNHSSKGAPKELNTIFSKNIPKLI
jgi:hypothetical protein